jgi:hypothetical protein
MDLKWHRNGQFWPNAKRIIPDKQPFLQGALIENSMKHSKAHGLGLWVLSKI